MEQRPEQLLAYYEPRVMVHRTGGCIEYAIHEVYFDRSGNVATYTLEALSPRCGSMGELQETLLSFLRGESDTVVMGDLGYEYSREAIEWWLEAFDAPPLEFEEDGCG